MLWRNIDSEMQTSSPSAFWVVMERSFVLFYSILISHVDQLGC